MGFYLGGTASFRSEPPGSGPGRQGDGLVFQYVAWAEALACVLVRVWLIPSLPCRERAALIGVWRPEMRRR